MGGKVTLSDALQKLDQGEPLSTTMLEPLGLSFEWFLRYSKLTQSRSKEVIQKLIHSHSGHPDHEKNYS